MIRPEESKEEETKLKERKEKNFCKADQSRTRVHERNESNTELNWTGCTAKKKKKEEKKFNTEYRVPTWSIDVPTNEEKKSHKHELSNTTPKKFFFKSFLCEFTRIIRILLRIFFLCVCNVKLSCKIKQQKLKAKTKRKRRKKKTKKI